MSLRTTLISAAILISVALPSMAWAGDFATCDPPAVGGSWPICNPAAGITTCCEKQFAAGSIIIPIDRCHQDITSGAFGYGRPYSRSQIIQLLRDAWFTPTSWGEALYVPPVGRGWFLRSAVAWERTGATLSAPFAGVHIVEATKQVYRAIPAHRERTRLIPSLQPVLVPSSTASRDKLES